MNSIPTMLLGWPRPQSIIKGNKTEKCQYANLPIFELSARVKSPENILSLQSYSHIKEIDRILKIAGSTTYIERQCK